MEPLAEAGWHDLRSPWRDYATGFSFLGGDGGGRILQADRRAGPIRALLPSAANQSAPGLRGILPRPPPVRARSGLRNPSPEACSVCPTLRQTASAVPRCVQREPLRHAIGQATQHPQCRSPGDTTRGTRIEITEVRFSASSSSDQARGMLGWIGFLIDGWLRVDAATLRRSRSGELYVAYPARSDAQGRQHYFLHPISDTARREVQCQVLKAIAAEVTS